MTHTIAPPTLEELNKKITELESIPTKWQYKTLKMELYCLYAVRDGVQRTPTVEQLANFLCGDLMDEDYDELSRSKYLKDAEAILKFLDCPVQSPWMDIETAPKDGSRILIAFANRHVCEAYWHKYWTNPCSGDVIVRTWRNDDDPISWMPLPAPPTQNSPPDIYASHNHGEGDPSVMPDHSGGDPDICGHRMPDSSGGEL